MIRRLHPDFHIPGYIDNVAAEFDGDAFADLLASANLDSVVIFAKCMFGFCYWNNTVGVHHPGLGDRDFFGEAVEACRRRGIETYAYYYPLVDAALNEDYKWRQRDPEGNLWWGQCPNTDYMEEYLLPQMKEVTRNYPITGWHVDGIVYRPEACWCERCREMMKEEGIDTNIPEEVAEFSRKTTERLARRMTEVIRSEREDVILSYNNLLKIGCRPQVKWSDVVDVEVYGDIGPVRASLFCRHVRTIGRKFAVTTSCRARGVAAYGSAATVEELRYIASLGMALGGYCQFINEMLPEGKMEPPLLMPVKEAYSFVKERERWCIGAEQICYAAIMGATEPGAGQAACAQGAFSGVLGAARLLKECHITFDVIDEEADLSPYKVIVLPEADITSPDVLKRLRDHVKNGGILFATGSTTLKDGEFALSDVFGVTYQGEGDDISYLRLGASVSANLPDMVRLVRGKWLRVQPAEKADRLAEIVRPRFADTGLSIGWGRPPEREDSGWPGILSNRFGSGWVLYSPAPLFSDYAQSPDEEQRRFMNNLLDLVAPPSERPVEIPDLPPSAETSLMKLEDMWILHIVRDGAVEPPELRDIEVTLRPDFKPASVYLAPERKELPFRVEGSEALLTLPRVGSHTILVLEP